jgi:hypothetical protein
MMGSVQAPAALLAFFSKMESARRDLEGCGCCDVFLEGCGNGKWHDDGAPCRLWLKKLSAKPSPAADCRGFLGQRLPPASRSPPGGMPAWHPEDSCQDFAGLAGSSASGIELKQDRNFNERINELH